jgi:hypothetical protein
MRRSKTKTAAITLGSRARDLEYSRAQIASGRTIFPSIAEAATTKGLAK